MTASASRPLQPATSATSGSAPTTAPRWSSARVAGKLPTQAAGWATGADSAGLGDVGRIALGAASNANPALASVYAEAGSVDEGNSRTVLLFSTRDGGGSWARLGTALSTNLTNPTSTVTFPDGTTENDCDTLDLGHGQSWYNLAVGVDPANPDHAIMGGNLCSVRTLDGGATWQNASHWLPSAGIGNTSDGQGALPYVHADWHTITIANGTVMAGTDGGLFTTPGIFAAGPTQHASWLFPDVGLVTHLAYAHGTGDPVRGNAQVLYAGFQDNGTRFRLFHPDPATPDAARTFDQIIGGDGIGCAVATDSDGQGPVYWASVEFGRFFCRPDARDCSAATTTVGGVEQENWVFASIPASQMPAGDGEVFLERFSPTYDAQSSVLTATATHAWKITVDPSDNVTYTQLTSAPLNLQNQSVYASPFTYTVGGVPARIYGIVTSGGKFGAIVDDGSGTFPLTRSATGMQVGGESILGATSVAFPRDPANLGGTDIRSTYVGTSGNTTDTAGNPVSDALGHIFKTIDGGVTWTPIHGAGVPRPVDSGAWTCPTSPSPWCASTLPTPATRRCTWAPISASTAPPTAAPPGRATATCPRCGSPTSASRRTAACSASAPTAAGSGRSTRTARLPRRRATATGTATASSTSSISPRWPPGWAPRRARARPFLQPQDTTPRSTSPAAQPKSRTPIWPRSSPRSGALHEADLHALRRGGAGALRL